jgi:hypothetical protein
MHLQLSAEEKVFPVSLLKLAKAGHEQDGLDLQNLQGNLTHKKLPPPKDHGRGLGMPTVGS